MSTILGLTRDARHRYSWNGGPLVPGVTSVIKAMDKPALVGWAKRTTAECAIRNLPLLNTMVKDGGPEAAVNWLKTIPDYQRETAADLGTRVHDLAEAIARGQDVTVDDEAAPFVTAYLRWRSEKKPRYLNAEYMVFSEAHRYGGTADIAAVVDGHVTLIDIKTGRDTYADTALQLAGLHNADWAGRPGDPKKYAIPKATRFGVLHIRPEGAELVPYQVGPAEFAAFLACRALTTWLTERAPHVKSATEKGVIAA